MEPPATVVGLVTGLVDAYGSLLHLYTRWEYSRSQRNTYRRQGQHHHHQSGHVVRTGGGGVGGASCALSTSLRISGPMIKETYDNGLAIVGNEFSTGDSGTREKLWAQLQCLNDRLEELQRATGSGPVELGQLLQTSEAARIATLRTLAAQYRRIAIGRPIPRELPLPKPQSRASIIEPTTIQQQQQQQRQSGPGFPFRNDLDDDRMTTAMTISSGPLGFQSNPPSPPPTPKLVPDDTEWMTTTTGGGGSGSEIGSMGMGIGRAGSIAGILRPKNSVFSVFCPEAMTFQVDPNKSTPSSSSSGGHRQRRCKCGYRWKPALPPDSNNNNNNNNHNTSNTKEDGCVLLKEGFRMTTRFLAKSHCDKRAYGCVLCTSSGKTEKYDSVEHLCAHINACHTKWQMLHDRDMA